MKIDHYFNQRVEALNLSPTEAIQEHGLSYDKNGNIIQLARHADGSPVMFLPKYGTKRKGWEKHQRLTNRKSNFVLHSNESDFYEQYVITRFNPKYLEKHPQKGKYKFPSKNYSGMSPSPMPNSTVIDCFNAHKKGEVLCLTEGYIKAVALSLQQIPAIAFGGISMFQLCEIIATYLSSCQPKAVVLLYDGDTNDIKTKQDQISDKRPKDFFASPKKFAKQFFKFCKKEGWNTKDNKSHQCQLYWANVAPKTGYKGVDDLLIAKATKQDQIIAALQSLKSSDYFNIIPLSKSNYHKKLKKALGLSKPQDFYQKHQHIIGNKQFGFDRLIYQNTTIYNSKKDLFRVVGQDYEYLKVISNPHEIEIPSIQLSVNRFLSEEQGHIDKLLKSADRWMIDAPTGIGKTSFFLGYPKGKKWVKGYFQRTKTKGVIVVPYKINVKQMRQSGVGVLCGRMTRAERMRAIQHDVVICTYDHLPNILDLESRIMIVDEAHNLVMQESFRSEALSYIVEKIESAKKSILISGTPSKALAKMLDCQYMEVERKENNIVKVHHVAAKDLTTTTIAQLRQEDWGDGKIRAVLYNNVQEAEKVKAYLIQKGILKADEIDINSRHHIDGGESSTYQGIINESIIKGVKLILCTCLLSEAININNTNISKIFVVQVDSISMFRQWIARFRKMETLDVYSIRKNKYNIAPLFTKPLNTEIDKMMDMAQFQTQILQKDYDRFIERHSSDDSEYQDCYEMVIDELVKDFHYKAQIFNLCYIDGLKVKVDTLKILREAEEEVLKGMNNNYYYSMLDSFPNIELVAFGTPLLGEEKTDEEDDSDIIEELSAQKKALKEQEQQNQIELINELEQQPSIVIAALKTHYKTTRNNRHNAFFNVYFEEIPPVDTIEADEFYSNHEHLFATKNLRRIIRQYLKLALAKPAHEVIDRLRNFSIQENHTLIKQIWHLIEATVHNSRRKRRLFYLLSPLHLREISSKLKMKALILAQFKDKKATVDELLELFSKVSSLSLFQQLYKRILQPVIKWTKTKMLNLMQELFNVEVDNMGNVEFTEIDTATLCPFLVGKHHPNYDKMLKMLMLA